MYQGRGDPFNNLHAFVWGPRVEEVVSIKPQLKSFIVTYCMDAKQVKRAKRAAGEREALNPTHTTC